VIHIYTGEGKGKTTAAVGLSLRARSRGLRVLFVQFMKSDHEGGETDLLDELSTVVMRFVEIRSPHFHPDLNIREMGELTRRALRKVREAAGDFDLVVIDEFNNLVRTGIISEADALNFMDAFPREKDIVLTGRGATEAMMDRADYVTYMKAVKHPLHKGMEAREGIEY
jgi:cob(I)alamin adenosyltransferase